MTNNMTNNMKDDLIDDLINDFKNNTINDPTYNENNENNENNDSKEINIAFDYIKKKLNDEKLQELSNKCNSINNHCKGDGCGLLSGNLIDMYITSFFNNELDNNKYEIFHKGESDMKICEIPFSFKKITGKSNIALNWSKNKDNLKKNYFTNDIIIMNLHPRKFKMEQK
jgi:hypothetical protein